MLLMVTMVFFIASFSLEGGFFADLFGIKSKKDDGKIKIGFLLKTMKESRYKKDKKYFIDAAYKAGADEVIFASADNNEKQQLEKLKMMIKKGIDILVIQAVDTSNIDKMLKEIHNADIKIISYSNLILNSPINLNIMPDIRMIGKEQGEAMLDWFAAVKGEIKGNVVLIQGDPDDSSVDMESAEILKIIEKNPGLNLVLKKKHINWSIEEAEKTATEVLEEYNNIDVFICNNSGMARGVLKALKERGLDDIRKVFVAGFDADLENIELILNRKQAVEIFNDVGYLAQIAAESAVKMVKNKNAPVEELFEISQHISNGYAEIPTIIGKVRRVTVDNIDLLIEKGYYLEEEIY